MISRDPVALSDRENEFFVFPAFLRDDRPSASTAHVSGRFDRASVSGPSDPVRNLGQVGLLAVADDLQPILGFGEWSDGCEEGRRLHRCNGFGIS